MLLCPFQDRAMRGGFVFEVVRLDIIFSHRMVLETFPHQDPAQVRMAIENNSIEIQDLALLKFAAAPNWRKRGQTHLIASILSAHSDDDRTMPLFDRVEMINR